MEPANRVHIFDTTLRDGEQAPGYSMNADEKLRMAQQLALLGVDTIEAGFAASSPGDFESVRDIGHTLKGPRVVSLCRTRFGDIDAAAEALKGSHHWGLHTVIATSPLHMKYKLKMEPDAVIQSARAAVERMRGYTDSVEFSAEDATRSEPEFLVRVFSEAVRAGATILNVPDTVGYTTPTEMHELIDRLRNEVYQAERVVFSVHCHNDLGMAVANSLAAIGAGARQVECTVNGIGERAGNAAVEEIVMSLKVRQQLLNLETGIRTQQIYPSSRLLSQLTGQPVQPNKAIVGANAFAHESGIHQDGVLKNPLTYEIMTPESVGLQNSHIVLGKHSGRTALAERLKALGYAIDREAMRPVFEAFKRLADSKKIVYDEDLEALMHERSGNPKARYQLLSVRVQCGDATPSRAEVVMKVGEDQKQVESSGNGPVDSIFNAIKNLSGTAYAMRQYKVNAVTGGTDAQGEVTVSLVNDEGREATGRGTHVDIIVASGRAYIDALNRFSAPARPHVTRV